MTSPNQNEASHTNLSAVTTLPPRPFPPSGPSIAWDSRSATAGVALLIGLATVALSASGCRVDQEDFNNRVFACNVASPDPGCGVDQNGQAMGCFASRQIGATDFCASTCDAATASGEDGEAAGVCLQSGISLRACHPSEDSDKAAHPLGACSQKDLQCYRTDLLSDDGVCTTMNPCAQDTECRDPIRSVCATTFLASLYSQASTALLSDHMYCLQTGCRSRGTSCSAGETCLQEVIPAAAHPPDICVPNCDSNLHCPPNFLCYRKVSTSITPNVCIPGLLGFTCDSAIDCMLGKCVDNGIGYKVCTTPCASQADCRRFDGEQGKFICIKNPADPTDPGNCQSPDSYRGSLCNVTDDCRRNLDEVCSRFNPKDAQGTCLKPCDAEQKCEPRAGINHTCLPSAVAGVASHVCFPGYFGLPCASDGNCVDDLSCRATVPGAPHICTVPCSTTADCAGNRWIGGDGWCHPVLAICLSKGDDGADCAVNDGCKSGRCAENKCAPQGGGQ